LGSCRCSFYQVSITIYNLTSIEEYTEKRFRRLAKRRGIEKQFKWFFDYGIMYNLRQVLGESILDWWKPETPKHVLASDGTRFKTRIYQDVPTATTVNSSNEPVRISIRDDDFGLLRRNHVKSEDQRPLL